MATAITKERLKELYSEHQSQDKVGKSLGRSQNFVWYWMKRLGVPSIFHGKISNDELKQLVYFDGMGICEISRMYNILRENVSKRITRLIKKEPLIPYEEWLRLPHEERTNPRTIRQMSSVPGISEYAAYLQILRWRHRHMKELG